MDGYKRSISFAKEISIKEFLQKNGYNPVKEENTSALFYSPLREESTPSFYVDTCGRYGFRWIDYGQSNPARRSGDIIDLVRLMTGKSFNEAVRMLNNDPCITSLKGKKRKHHRPANRPSRKITRITTLENNYLKWYVKERCIPISLAIRFLLELHYIYINTRVKRYAIAFRNDNGGYELAYKQKNILTDQWEPQKSTFYPKYITTFKGNNKLDIFEGFWDALSYLAFYKLKDFPNSCIVLNSISNLNKVIPTLNNYQLINTFLDNDKAGRDATRLIKENHDNVRDWSQILYKQQNDFNDFLRSKYAK